MLLWCIRTTTHTYNYIHKYNYNNYLRPAAADATTKHLAERNNVVTIKICGLSTESIIEISNTRVDNAKDAVTLMYSLIECSDNYFKTSGSLWQYYL